MNATLSHGKLSLHILGMAVIAILCLCALPARADNNDNFTLNFDVCYEELEPFGTWYEIDEYGWVWRPYGMLNSWQPYTRGRWECTDAGWLWVSDFEWGWLVFHYGRWYYHRVIGWCWVPGYEWSPAWVTWYSTDDYIGWAPIPPCAPGESFTISPDHWFFVSANCFMMPRVRYYAVSGYCVGPVVCAPYIVVNNYYFWGGCYYYYSGRRCVWYGPPVQIIERHVRRKLPRRRLVTTTTRRRHASRDNGKRIEVFRPASREVAVRAGDAGRQVRGERVKQSSARIVRETRTAQATGTPSIRERRSGGSIARHERTPSERRERPRTQTTPSPSIERKARQVITQKHRTQPRDVTESSRTADRRESPSRTTVKRRPPAARSQPRQSAAKPSRKQQSPARVARTGPARKSSHRATRPAAKPRVARQQTAAAAKPRVARTGAARKSSPRATRPAAKPRVARQATAPTARRSAQAPQVRPQVVAVNQEGARRGSRRR